MEKEIKIIAPEGFEIDKENSTFEVIKFKEKPKVKKLPQSWEELKTVEGFYVDSCSEINDYSNSVEEGGRNTFPSIQEAEAAIALAQLCQLRDRYNDGWKPDWEDVKIKKYCIIILGHRINNDTTFRFKRVLSFKTADLRDEFLSCPEIVKLIEIAKPLL